MANFALTVAFASVDGVAIVTGHAALAVRPSCQVPTVLTHAAVHTPAVTITLARWEQIVEAHTQTHTDNHAEVTMLYSQFDSCRKLNLLE